MSGVSNANRTKSFSLAILMIMMAQVGYLEHVNPWKANEDTLGQTANEIRKLAQRHPNKFNWAPFDEAFVESTEQLQNGQFTESFGNMAKAITYIMSEFRK